MTRFQRNDDYCIFCRNTLLLRHPHRKTKRPYDDSRNSMRNLRQKETENATVKFAIVITNNPFGCVLSKYLPNYKSIWEYPKYYGVEWTCAATWHPKQCFVAFGWPAFFGLQRKKKEDFIQFKNPNTFQRNFNIDLIADGIRFRFSSLALHSISNLRRFIRWIWFTAIALHELEAFVH